MIDYARLAPPRQAGFLWTYATITWQRQEPEGSRTGVGLVNFFAIVHTFYAIKLMFDKMDF